MTQRSLLRRYHMVNPDLLLYNETKSFFILLAASKISTEYQLV